MWAYLLFIPRTEFDDGGDAELTRTRAAALHTHPGTNAQPGGVPPLFTYVGKKRVWVLVKADLTDAQAETISNNDQLLTGSVKLIWWEAIMSADFQRHLDRNDAKAASTMAELVELATLLKTGNSVPAGVDKERALAFFAEKVSTLPDGPDKDRLLEILRGRKETKH